MGTSTVPPATVSQAFRILGIQGSISKPEEITSAFRRKVKAASVGHGNFRGDMDILTQAKEVLLEALAIAYAKAEQAQARERAQQQEREERERLKAKQARDQAKKKVVPLQLGPGTVNRNFEALRAYERKIAHEREEARRAYDCYIYRQCEQMREERIRQEQERHCKRGELMETEQKIERSNDLITDALNLLQAKETELEQLRKREQEIAQELKGIQMRRSKLEQAMQTAMPLALQLRTILEAVTQ